MNNKRNAYVKTAMYKIIPLHFAKVTLSFYPNGLSPENFGVDPPGK